MDSATICIKTVLILLANAEKYLEHFIIETKPSMHVKYSLNFEIKKLQSVFNDLMMLAGPEHSQIIRKEIRDNWELISIQNVLGMMVQLDDEDRIKIENFAEELLNKKIN